MAESDWWKNSESRGHLEQALDHLNWARSLRDVRKTERCRTLFDVFNTLWTGLNAHCGEGERSDSQSSLALLQVGLKTSALKQLLESPEFISLVSLEPQILNHDVLRRRHWRPNEDPSPELKRHATEAHRKLSNATREVDPADQEKHLRILKKLAELLYVVRSNIAHGEKTPYGIDHAKARRDEHVSGTVVPVQLKLLSLLLDHPEENLVVYGTLQPGGANEPVLEGIDGSWTECRVHGELREVDDLLFFRRIRGPGQVTCRLLRSSELRNTFARLDEFEGSRYERILVPAETGSGLVVANIYAGNTAA